MKISKIGLYIIIGILIVFLLHAYSMKDKAYQQIDNERILRTEQVKIYKNKYDELIASRTDLIVTNKELKNDVYLKDSLLKEMTKKKSKISYVLRVKTDTIKLPSKIIFKDSISNAFSKSFDKNEEWYRLTGVVTNKFIRLNVSIPPITVRLVTGTDKGFFKRESTTQISFDNPMIKVKDVVGQKSKQRVKRFVIGVGAVATIQGNSNLGVFIGYSLIRF